ncbi:MAG TPA: fatty acid desaturase [Sphingobium sp.]|uniref:fatty acid desaturase n=1 Tax=Sphingobium sp. TaxID=1912891 RepID=UPI002ED1D0EE
MQSPNSAVPSSRPGPVELPTLLLAIVIHGAWVLLTLWHATIPPLMLGMAGGIVVAWHGSLQHETIHGHPTGQRWINSAIGSVPLSLWLPYSIYRRTHVAHHATPNITDPFDDPESHYLTRGSGLRYWLARAEETLLGRLLLGPPIRIGHFLLTELRRATREPGAASREWIPHLAGVAVLLAWLHHVDLSLGQYLLAFVYPGTALSLLRSFAEHRADEDRSARAAIIPRAGPFGLLFLNNNLHAVHHARPELPWYRLPEHYRHHGAAFSYGPHYSSYGAVIRRYLLRPHDAVLHPDHIGRQEAA